MLHEQANMEVVLDRIQIYNLIKFISPINWLLFADKSQIPRYARPCFPVSNQNKDRVKVLGTLTDSLYLERRELLEQSTPDSTGGTDCAVRSAVGGKLTPFFVRFDRTEPQSLPA